MEGPVYEFLSKLADFVILNLLFVVCSIPIVTIGASMTAMSYVMIKMKEGEEGYVWKSFFHSFRQNFLQATAIWLMLLAAFILLVLDVMILRNSTGTPSLIMKFVILLGFLIWLLETLYVFPILSRFVNTIRGTMKNALLLALANAPKAILSALVTGLAIAATLWNVTTFAWGVLIWVMVGFTLLCWVNITLMLKLLRKIAGMPEDGGKPAEEEYTPLPDLDENGDPIEAGDDLPAENAVQTAVHSPYMPVPDFAKSSFGAAQTDGDEAGVSEDPAEPAPEDPAAAEENGSTSEGDASGDPE